MDLETETFVQTPFNIIGMGQKGKNHAYEAAASGCLQQKGLAATGNEAGTLIVVNATNALRSMQSPAIAFDHKQTPIARKATPPLRREGAGGGIYVAGGLRRLTPRECERLQGFPDDYTLVQYCGKPAADGPRYKAIGNSMAVPVMAWIARRIELAESIVISPRS